MQHLENQNKDLNRCPRCVWDPLYEAYHDDERGVPVYDDRVLFEFLVLEGAQAGLSWITILRKREWYRKAFKNFDPQQCSQLDDDYLESLRDDASIVRNKLKIYSVRKNAKIFLAIQAEFGSFSDYLRWRVDHTPVISYHNTLDECPTTTELSDQISKDLKRRGMSFVWSTIMYAYLQAVGVVDDHILSCHKRKSR